MRVRLVRHALEDDKGLRTVETLAAPREKTGTRFVTAFFEPLIEDLSVLFLNWNGPLHMAALP